MSLCTALTVGLDPGEVSGQEFTPSDIAVGPAIRVTVTDTISGETMSYPPAGAPPAIGLALAVQDPSPAGIDSFANYDFNFTTSIVVGSPVSGVAVTISSGPSVAASVIQTGAASRLHISVEAGGGFPTLDSSLGSMIIAGAIFGGATIEYYAAAGYERVSPPAIAYKSFPQYLIARGAPPSAVTPLSEFAYEQPIDPGAISLYAQLLVSTGVVGDGVLLPGSAGSGLGEFTRAPNAAGTSSRQTGTVLNPIPIEFVTRRNKRVMTPRGPLSAEPGSVLFTILPDAPGPLWPSSGPSFGGGEVDALAHQRDLYYEGLIRNQFPLEVSFSGDPGNGAGDRIATYMEQPVGTRQPHFLHSDLYRRDSRTSLTLEDVDGIEYWGPPNEADASVFSLSGDAISGTSVYVSNGGVQAYLSHDIITHAVHELGYRGEDEAVDVDAILVKDLASNGEWNAGDEILFSIRAAGNWDGGEIVRLRNMGGALELPSFLIHGGHRWDTAFNLQQAFPFLTSDDVDAIEVIPVVLPEESTVTITSTRIGDEGGLIIDFDADTGLVGWQVWGGKSPASPEEDLVALGMATVSETKMRGKYTASVFAESEQYYVQIETPDPLLVGEVIGAVNAVAGSTTSHHVAIHGGLPPFAIQVPEKFTDTGVVEATIYSDGVPAEFEVYWAENVTNVSGYLSVIVTDARGEKIEVAMAFETWTTSDVDGDGLPDAWEELNGLDPFDATGDAGATGDMDGDGSSNLSEFRNGTGPNAVTTDKLAGRDWQMFEGAFSRRQENVRIDSPGAGVKPCFAGGERTEFDLALPQEAVAD